MNPLDSQSSGESLALERDHTEGPEEGDLHAADEEAEDSAESFDGAKLFAGDLIDDGFKALQIEGYDVGFNHFFEVDGFFKVSRYFFHQWSGFFLDRCSGDHFELRQYAFVNKTSDERNGLQLGADALPDEGVGGSFQMGGEVHFPNLVEDAVLLEDFPFDDLSSLCC